MRPAALLAVVFLLSTASALDIDVVAENEVPAYDTWQIQAYVTNETVNVSYPSCNLTVTRAGETVLEEDMLAAADYAHSSASFGETGTYTADVQCYGETALFSFSVQGNSDVSVDLGYVTGIGDSLQISASYVDTDENPIYPATCEAKIYVDGDYQDAVSLYYNSGQGKYLGWYTITESGDHSVTVTCTAGSHSTASDTDSFEVERFPVTISPGASVVSGSYGDRRTVAITVSPSTASCEATYGTLGKVTATYYSLVVDLDFVGDKTVTVTCSAPQYTTSSKTIKFSSALRNTRLSAGFSTEKPFSFQKFYVTPNYYDEGWNAVKGADCTVEFEGSVKEAKSFESTWFRASPGPKESSVRLSCKKYGYKPIEGMVAFDIQAIAVTGDLQYPGNAKLNQPLAVRVSLYPQIEADCDFEAELEPLAGGTIERFELNDSVKGTGEFSVTPTESGDMDFTVTCNSLGYTEFSQSGTIRVSVFSQEEETSATIILTILTIILAVGFLLLKRWM